MAIIEPFFTKVMIDEHEYAVTSDNLKTFHEYLDKKIKLKYELQSLAEEFITNYKENVTYLKLQEELNQHKEKGSYLKNQCWDLHIICSKTNVLYSHTFVPFEVDKISGDELSHKRLAYMMYDVLSGFNDDRLKYEIKKNEDHLLFTITCEDVNQYAKKKCYSFNIPKINVAPEFERYIRVYGAVQERHNAKMVEKFKNFKKHISLWRNEIDTQLLSRELPTIRTTILMIFFMSIFWLSFIMGVYMRTP
mgnify:CR=1 FL=1